MKRNKTKVTLCLGAFMTLLISCSDNTIVQSVEREDNAKISFANYVSGNTRASRTTGASFIAGDEIQVWGFQILDGDTSKIFNGTRVTHTGSNVWNYADARYWQDGSEYDFYAIYPYSPSTVSFNQKSEVFSISEFTVSDNSDEQQDVMIAVRKTGHKPYNVVDFEFNHILSNVSFLVRTAPKFDTTLLDTVEIESFDVTGLYSKGEFTQSGWNNNTFVGKWSADSTSVYDLPEVKNAKYIKGKEALVLAGDLMLLPQQINDNAKIYIKFKFKYADGTETMFRREAHLNKIVGKKKSDSTTLKLATWEPNYLYRYIIQMDPSRIYDPTANPDHDADDYDNPDEPIGPNINIIEVDNDNDGITDEWLVDENGDGDPDYPIIWKDVDGDGKEEAIPDRDEDGQPDDSDGDGNPDVIYVDGDGDGTVDTEMERDKEEVTPGIDTEPNDPENPKDPNADYDGGESGGYDTPSGWIVEEDGELMIDTDGDGKGDLPIVWKDIDGDGKLEGVVDKDGDGKLTPADSFDNDGKDYNGDDNDYDVIKVVVPVPVLDEDGNPVTDEDGNIVYQDELVELEKTVDTPDLPEVKDPLIRFSAEVLEWEDEYEATYSSAE